MDTHRLAEETAGLLAVQIADRGVGVEIAALPEVRADAVLLGGVFMNLFTNALKYGPQTGGRDPRECRARRRGLALPRGERGPADRAAGARPPLPPVRPRHGGAPGDGDRARARALPRIVERHGGEIGIRPLPGWGNAVEFTLPD